MSSDYRTVETSHEVWAVIRARHRDLMVFGSHTAPHGDEFTGPGRARIFTSYALPGTDFPIMEAETLWEFSGDAPHVRKNERTRYWLCVARKEET